MTTPDPTTIIAGAYGAPSIAVDVLPDNVPGTFLVDYSEADGPDLLGWGLDGWANIVCDVTRLGGRRGMTRLQGPLTRAEAGSVSVELLDTNRRFDPMVNADAIHPGTPVRARVWGVEPAPWSAVLFTGRIGADFDVRYQREGPPVVAFSAVDIIGRLAAFESFGRPDPGVGTGDDLRDRTVRVLAELGLPDTSLATDSDAAYSATLAPSPLAGGWDDITRAADAELGRVWVNTADQLVTRARGSLLSGPVRGTLSDWHGEAIGTADTSPHCCYTDPVVRFGTDSLVNRAIGARRVPPTADGAAGDPSAIVQVDDAASQARWTSGVPVAHRDTALELEDDAQLQPWGEWLVLAASEPELRVDSVQVTPRDAQAWQAVCSTDIGDRWYFRLHPEVGATVASTLGVLGIEYDISPEGWFVTWTTAQAPTPGDLNPSGWFTVDLSEVDGEDVLPPFGGAVSV